MINLDNIVNNNNNNHNEKWPYNQTIYTEF